MSSLHCNFLDKRELLVDKYIFVDNDFLVQLFLDDIAFESYSKFFYSCYSCVDDYTKFEFLRSVSVDFSHKKEDTRELFLKNDCFTSMTTHADQFKTAMQSVISLARAYTIKYPDNKSSFIDFMLGVRLLQNPEKHLLITGNRKDFPLPFFKNEAILTYVADNSLARTYYLLSFQEHEYKPYC